MCLLILAGALKVATFKTAAAPAVKGAVASTSAAYATGTATTVVGSVLVGITLTGAAMAAMYCGHHR
jgi:hypothetical protein